MDEAPSVEDSEVILRHIPAGTTFQAPGPRITSINFQVRAAQGESGVSVSRDSMTTVEQLVARVGGDLTKGSRVAAARVAEIRSLGLEVVPDPLEDDPGHAEIRSNSVSLDDHLIRKRLANLFRLLPIELMHPPAEQGPTEP